MGCDFVVAGLDEPASVAAALNGVDRLLLNSGGALPVAGQQPMARQRTAAIDAARAAGVAQVVKVSPWLPREDAKLSVRAHWEIEQHLKASGLRWAMLQPTGYMQNFFTSQDGFASSRGARPSMRCTSSWTGAYAPLRIASMDSTARRTAPSDAPWLRRRSDHCSTGSETKQALGPPCSAMRSAFAVPATHRRVWDFSRDGILRSVEDSLTRLGTDRIDVLYLHDAEERFEAALRDGYPALAELRAQGVVGAVGAGMYHPGKLTRLVRETDADVVMLSGRYTLLDHSALDELLPACAERGVSILAASVFNSGLLATDRPAPGARFDYAPAAPELLKRAHQIADVCEAHGVTVPQAAMAFPLLHPVVAGIVVGMRTTEEVRRNLDAFDVRIPAQLWSDLREEDLLDERAPTDTAP
ncbi:aldo/keto reductase [Streptomyces sp. NPDC041068]|uniref:aldo/keto reductase n=1 Tax=Streptomyces sp. NPDC041068 TaxID=3155130 RepID=UPI0033F344A4